jgi:hypothetical protein
LEPGQPRQSGAAQEPDECGTIDRGPRPQRRPRDQQPARQFREDQPRVWDERDRQAAARPCKDCRPGPGERFGKIEYCERSQRSEQRDEGDGACPPGNRIRRQDERRKSRRMDRVDLPVLAALEKIRPQIAGPVRLVVALPVVVLDLQITVFEQALGDDQVVRLVAAGPDRLLGIEAHAQVHNETHHEHRPSA